MYGIATSGSLSLVRPPLRYPGGKFYDLRFLLPLISDFDEFREPMVGAGNMFFNLRARFPLARFWINDVDEPLVVFYTVMRNQPEALYREVLATKYRSANLRDVYDYVFYATPKNDVQKAAFYFIKSRCSFNALGTQHDRVGFSEIGARRNFSDEVIGRIIRLASLLEGVKITHLDYEDVTRAAGDGRVLAFLDPPYYYADKTLYRSAARFDHLRLRKVLGEADIRWMLTYDDADEIREMYSDFFICAWGRKHRMNQHLRSTEMRQLLISNYQLPYFQGNLFAEAFNVW